MDMDKIMSLNEMSKWLTDNFGLSVTAQHKIFTSIAIFTVVWIISFIIDTIISKKVKDPKFEYNLHKTVGYVSFFIAIILVGRIWLEGFQSLATFFGLFSAGLAIALKDIIADIAAWIYIMWRRPFRVGDRIQIGLDSGDVIDFGPFQITLLEIGNWVNAEQSTGRMVHVPNNKVFTESLANYTKGFEFIWDEIPILVTFESDRNKTKSILEEVLTKHTLELSQKAEHQIKMASKKFMILSAYIEPKVYTSLEDSGVMYTLRYLCDPYARRELKEEILEDIFKELDKHNDIDFAYPTKRVFENSIESKIAVAKQ